MFDLWRALPVGGAVAGDLCGFGERPLGVYGSEHAMGRGCLSDAWLDD